MTQGERMVWAATYAAAYVADYKDPNRRGEVYIAGCIELAWSAVAEMRENRQAVVDGWGDTFDVLPMLDEMLEAGP